LNAGADPDTASPEGETALMTAARTGGVGAVGALLGHGAKVDAREGWRGQTALMWAALENHPAVVVALIERGADVNASSDGGFTALLFAIRAGHIEIVRTLLAAGARVNEPLPDGTTPLNLAIINAHYELAAVLLTMGARANDDSLGWTPLHQLVWTRRPNTNRGLIPPVPTGKLDSLELVAELVAHGADVNARQRKEPKDGFRNLLKRAGATPFLLAAKAADLELMRVLVANGADPLMSTEGDATPLMVAAGVGIWQTGESPGTNAEALDAVKLALQLGGDVKAVDANGDTALHGAAYRGADDIVQFLVDNGAQLDVINERGWTPLRIAEGVVYPNTFNRRPEMAMLLRKLGANPDAEMACPPRSLRCK
jgi:ankyrin repeat protein